MKSIIKKVLVSVFFTMVVRADGTENLLGTASRSDDARSKKEHTIEMSAYRPAYPELAGVAPSLAKVVQCISNPDVKQHITHFFQTRPADMQLFNSAAEQALTGLDQQGSTFTTRLSDAVENNFAAKLTKKRAKLNQAYENNLRRIDSSIWGSRKDKIFIYVAPLTFWALVVGTYAISSATKQCH